MFILGINAYHGDSAACIIKDGELIAAVEEERFSRIKHWAGFPRQAIDFVLQQCEITMRDVEYVAINRDPHAHFWRKVLFTFTNMPGPSLVINRLKNRKKVASLENILQQHWPEFDAKVIHVHHHLAHIASSFFLSGMERAAVCSVDGFGDFASTMIGVGEHNEIQVNGEVLFPHSLGLFYLAITQFLGFDKYGDEYKVMGLSPYGEKNLMREMRQIVLLQKNGLFRLNLPFFCHHRGGGKMSWDGGEPKIETVYSAKLSKLLGPPRGKHEEINEHHRNIAASMQAMYEEAVFHILTHLHRKTHEENLALAGGCAMNSVANGKIHSATEFKNVYIPAAAGDAGGAIGAAYYVHNVLLGNKRIAKEYNAYLGPGYDDAEIENALHENEKLQQGIAQDEFCVVQCKDDEELTAKTATAIVEGKVIGWFQGKMEWGPRALGNRSIVVDPRREDMREILNAKIKRRESFRPFAPSILREHVCEYFTTDTEVPFMMMVLQIKKEKHSQIPAVTHVDGSGRLQTVAKEQNPLYYKLIEKFYQQTGIPLVLNTSFNENEPIVNTPQQALQCFLRTKMDVIAMGNYIVSRV
ncbi:carbamoyltransferase family protein [Candidatus Uabimicrobium amorphum]|uniref:Carbamoyltransferase n=1 Tax=Uabimicrobium amorphum TaxID=2596890 RepID=A0A5S9F264_UABAM|nr:carbamoyltransferase C-terminal domain-containing protein [Candidatus Uabimicrobium amorphum]BBM83286.1 carbamoyltransferase [Candidatus Uabimicrobium amorphum]